ncbi:MAG: ATP-binding protein [Desulfovermiculus sp.]
MSSYQSPSDFGNQSELINPQEAQDILQHAPVGIFKTSPEGRYLYANQTLAEMYGYGSPQELMGFITEIATQVYAEPQDRAKLLQQILFNLVGNSIKYTEEGKVNLEVTAYSPADGGQKPQVLFQVQDTGIGIPEDKLQNLFEPFVQVDGSLTRSYQGAGLGLSIVRRLVELMGGSLSIQSKAEQGTSVQVVLPMELPAEYSQGQHDVDEGPRHSERQGLRLLLAEDEPSNQLFVQRLMQNAGHQVTVADNGEEALELLAQHDFDCVLMDIQLPVLDGVEATKKIRSSQERFRDIPIIALPAYAMAGDREKLLEQGLDDYIAKPVEKNELLAVLEKSLNGPDPK